MAGTKVALVIGGGSGIGRGVVERLARDGDDVCVIDLDVDAAEESATIARRLGRRAVALQAHAGSQQSIVSAFERCVSELQRVDYVVAWRGDPPRRIHPV